MSADIPSGKAFRQPKSTALKIDNRVQVNQDRLRGIGKLISRLSDQTPYNFVDSTVPPLNHSLTIDFFFVTTLQQFSFWTIKDDRYHLPLIDTIGGEELKGSAYLYKAYNQKIDSDPDYFSAGRQSNQTLAEMLELFRSDNGVDVMPAVELHLAASHRYGNSMRKLGWTPEDILIAASESDRPLENFLLMLDHVGGYCEDPLRKKSLLLASILHSRPERYLEFGSHETIYPIIDYHLMRASLRMGMIDVRDEELQDTLKNRTVITEDDEWAVRFAAYHAIERLPQLSGRSQETIDHYLFTSRIWCPEMTEPECSSCHVDPVCAHRVELFQPVIRTDYY